MNRIGILTYHHVANWGSALQAYCLYSLVRRLFPTSTVELIDYVPQTSFEYSRKRTASRHSRFRFFGSAKPNEYQRKLSACTTFLSRHCQLSNSHLCSDSLEAGRDFLLEQNYDCVFVGSDTVFQLGSNFGGTYVSAPQAPNLYFLPFEAPFKKIAFAASANPFSPSMLAHLDVQSIRSALSDFDWISYRDEATRDALLSLGVADEKLSFVPDPTFLVDFDTLADKHAGLSSDSDIAAVAVGNRKLAKAMMHQLKARGYNPVDLLTGIRSEGSPTIAAIASVEQYLASFRQYRLVVTDRFHGSIISFVVGDCRVVGVEESERYPEENSKLRDLFYRLNLEHMVYRNTGDVGEESGEWLNDFIDRPFPSKRELMGRMCRIRHEAFANLSPLVSGGDRCAAELSSQS